MRNRKTVLYVLLMVLGIILVYNYLIAPIFMQNNIEMGMGMHWRMYTNTNYIIDSRIIFLIAIVIAGLLLYELLKPRTKKNKCCKCGKQIESEQWKICPICGSSLNERKG